jgi:hypothetical protein
MCKTWDDMDVDDLPIISGRIYLEFNMKESAQMLYFSNYIDELGGFNCSDLEFYSKSHEEALWEYENVIWKLKKDKQKILILLENLLYAKVYNRMKMLGRDDPDELNRNEEYWEKFNIHWRTFIAIARKVNWNWNEFDIKAVDMVKKFLKLENYISEVMYGRIIENTGKRIEDLSLEEFMKYYHGILLPNKYVKNMWETQTKNRSRYRKFYMEGLKEDKVPRAIYQYHRKSEKVCHKLKEIRFEEKKKDWETTRSSISIGKEKIIEEDEYEIRTTWNKIIPTQEKPIIVRTTVEKIANEEMKLMYSFIKENVQGRICRKPRNVEEFYDDILYYLGNRQARRYIKNGRTSYIVY